ncbi:MAG TPA: RNA polymerase subunit sigma-70 [Candidatus Acidoferrales bacterium]|nr:RNA polymerase subunit sigma-70 [Candidatus Acidoferrales bacterium]
MTPGSPPQPQAATPEEFGRLAEPFRRELQVHCYRMLGSVHEAEDLVQETYLRAWRGFDSFKNVEGGSFRAWLYRIATNACLNALASRKDPQRFLPHQLGPATLQMPSSPATDVAWLEPYPNACLAGFWDEATNPESRYAAREAVQLAFVAAIQLLPARQRAVLLLCDVLGWAAAEAATLLESSTVSINSALQRARETLAKHYPGGPQATPLSNPAHQRLLGRYLDAWQRHNVNGFVALLKEDATVTMPPWREWFVGRDTIGSFFATAWKTCNGLRLVPTGANGQPAFAVYELSSAPDARWAAHSIHVLSLDQEMISTITMFVPPAGPNLFKSFELPLILPDAGGASTPHHS